VGLFAATASRKLIPAYGAGPVCFLANDKKEEKPDKYQNRASGQSQCASGKENEAKTGKHNYEGDDINNCCVFINVHNKLPTF
jgi:hypothetical protein